MPMARIGQTIFLFVHIPKTGGTSIERYMASHGQVCLATKRVTGFSRVTPQHMERETLEAYIPAAFYDQGFAILRDPLERLQSEFRHQIRLSKAWPRLLSELHWLGKLNRRDLSGNGSEFVRLRDFDGWTKAVLTRCNSDPFICDNHIRPQADFILPGHRLFDFAAGLDQVARWIDRAAGIAGNATPVPHEKRSEKKPIEVSEKTRRRIAAFYRQDYALLNELSVAV